MRKWTISTAVLILLALSALSASAQEAAAEPRAVVYLSDISDQPDGRLKELIRASLKKTLEDEGFALVDQAGEVGNEFDGEPEAILKAAAESAADIAMIGFFRRTETELYFQVKIYDVERKSVLFTDLEKERPDLSFYNALREMETTLRTPLRAFLENRSAYRIPDSRVKTIVFKSPDEGAAVYFADRYIGAIENGELTAPYMPFELGTEVVLRVSKSGYHDRIRNIVLDSTVDVIALRPLAAETSYGASVSWRADRWLGIGGALRIYLAPDSTYAEFQLGLSSGALNRLEIHADAAAMLGQYLFLDSASPVRLHASIGAGFVWSTVDEGEAVRYADWYISIVNPTVEFSLVNWTFFAGLEFRYALGLGSDFYGRAWLFLNDVVPPPTVGILFKW